jgi:phosphomannomutase
MHHFHPSILREYDIRGIVDETLTAKDAYAIGRAFASFKPEWKSRPPRIAVGRDGRISSPEMEAALVAGLTESGADVIRVGIGPTPMLYFTVCTHNLDGGIMVTGSHNPPSHNGFKFMLGRKPFYGADIARIGVMTAKSEWFTGKGQASNLNIAPEYVRTLLDAYKGDKALKVAWDAGNGAAGNIMTSLTQSLPGHHTTLFAAVDGTFPNHHPDPSQPENLQDLIRTVREHKCDLGIAFDGDGDRIGAVDETGDIIWGDQLLALYAADMLLTSPGATVIADVKTSQSVFDEIARLGGNPLMWKTGHSLIKSKMAETGAKLAGEVSGHMFFADRYFGFDDALYAAVRLISLLSQSGKSLSALRSHLPKTEATPEMRIACDEERKFTVVDEVKTRLSKTVMQVNDVDGVRVNTADGWWLLRASNTQAVLVARCESTSKEGLGRLLAHLGNELSASGVKFPPEGTVSH